MPVGLRRVLLLAPPLLLAALEVIHPQPDEKRSGADGRVDVVRRVPRELALAGLVAVSVPILGDSVWGVNAWLTRVGLGVFLVFFSAHDAVAGIATGLAMRSARELSAVQQEGVFDVVKDCS
jgi:hypothetical protein